MKRILPALALALAVLPSIADITNRIDMVNLARGGEGSVAGWYLHGVTNYVESPHLFKFSVADGYALSPVFDSRVRGVVVCSRSSSAAGRRLALTPVSADAASEFESLAVRCDYSPTKNIYTNTVVSWSAESDVRRFRIAYDDGGGSTVWGVRWIDVITEGEVETAPKPVMSGGAVLLSSCLAGTNVAFELDLGSLAKCELTNGVIAGACAFATAGSTWAAELKENQGKTQYAGHYLWIADGEPSGIGTYTASHVSRSFGWIFLNDTDRDVSLGSVAVTFGQWGARNASLPDTLAAEWCLSESAPDVFAAEGWALADEYVAPATNTLASPVSYPVFRDSSLGGLPTTIPAGAYFAVRFTDTCPESGYNAHLGVAAFTLGASVVDAVSEWASRRNLGAEELARAKTAHFSAALDAETLLDGELEGEVELSPPRFTADGRLTVCVRFGDVALDGADPDRLVEAIDFSDALGGELSLSPSLESTDGSEALFELKPTGDALPDRALIRMTVR